MKKEKTEIKNYGNTSNMLVLNKKGEKILLKPGETLKEDSPSEKKDLEA